MSYDVSLKDARTGETVELPIAHDIRGGTYQVGGTSRAWLNVTYNYCGILRSVLPEGGLYELQGKTVEETIPLLKEAIEKLAPDDEEDYWKETSGNVRKALEGLLKLALASPIDSIWTVE